MPHKRPRSKEPDIEKRQKIADFSSTVKMLGFPKKAGLAGVVESLIMAQGEGKGKGTAPASDMSTPQVDIGETLTGHEVNGDEKDAEEYIGDGDDKGDGYEHEEDSDPDIDLLEDCAMGSCENSEEEGDWGGEGDEEDDDEYDEEDSSQENEPTNEPSTQPTLPPSKPPPPTPSQPTTASSLPPILPTDAISQRIAELEAASKNPGAKKLSQRLLKEAWADMTVSHGKKSRRAQRGVGAMLDRMPRECFGPGWCKNELCDHLFSRVYQPPPEEIAAKRPLLDIIMKKSEKDGFPVSEACCLYFLNMNGDKIIPTLEGIKRDILMREEKLKATGRINWEREILILADRTKPTSSKVRCRDEQIRCLEEDDANFKAVLSHGWRSPYAMTVKGTYKEEKQRQAEFKVYQDEAKFRETRAKVYEKLRGRGATPEELEAQMEKWDRSNNNTAEFLHDAHKVDMIANPVTAKEVADAKDASLRQIALNLAGDTEESKREFGMDTGQLLTPEEIAYNRALYIWLTAYIRKHSAPSSTTPTGRPRRNHRSSTHLEAPLMALYKPADMRELPASLEFEDETMQYEHEMCMLETHLRRFYVGLMDFYDGPRKKEYWSEAHLLAESSLFEFCYNLNVAFANWTRKNPRALQNVEGFGYLNYLPQALVSGREAVIFFKRIEHFFMLPSSRCLYLENCLERWPSLDQTAKDRIRQKQEQYDPRISFNERGLIFPGIDDNRKSFFSLWDRPPKDDLRKLKATGLKIGPPIPTTTAHSSKSQPTGSEVTTPTPSLNTAAHSETAQKGVPMGPFDMTNPIYREHVEAARHALQEMTLARKNISTYLDTPAFGTETGSTPEKLEGDLTSAEKLQRARAEATEAYKQRRLRRAEGLSKSKPVAQGKSEFASDKGKEAGDTDKSGEVKEPKVAEKNVEGMKEAIQQAAIDKVAGRAAMLRNIRGQTTPTKSEEDSRTSNPTQTGKQEEDSQTSTPAQTGKQKEEQKIIIKVPVPDAYDINGFRLVEEKEVTRVIAKPRKKSTQTMFKDMNKSKVDKTVNLVSKGEGDGSGKEEAQTAPAVNESGGDEYAVKGGDEAVPEGVVEKDEDGSTEDEAFDYEDHIIRRFPDMWEYFLQTQREATPRIEHRSEHWTEKKAQAAQEELVEYWSQFDKATRKLFHTMNGMYMVLGDGKVTNGPFSEMEVNMFLSYMDLWPRSGLSVIVICEFLGLANNDPGVAYKLFSMMRALMGVYFENIGVVFPRRVQYEEKMIEWCSFVWTRLTILARANMPDEGAAS